MKVFYTVVKDGSIFHANSAFVAFFDSEECITKLEEKGAEGYRAGEGGGSFEVPDGTIITGIQIQTMADVEEQLTATAE